MFRVEVLRNSSAMVLEAPKNPRFSTAATSRASLVQVIFGVVPAAISVLVLLGIATGISGNHAWVYRMYFLSALLGLAGLVWAVIPSPRWAAWPILGLLVCGYAAVGIFVWSSSFSDTVGSAAMLIFISPLVAGPMVVGAYQVTKIVSHLCRPQEDHSIAA